MIYACLGLAQTDQARLTGTVTDTSGAVIPDAAVKAKNERTGSERVTKSDGQGHYVFTNLQPATYTVAASASGMGPAEVSTWS